MTSELELTNGIWRSMLARCHNPGNKRFADYGGRGIVVCERWRRDVGAFLADMGERPDGHSLDRIDNDGPYSPENCRWATRREQQNNSRRNLLLTYDGVTLSVAAWARRLGVPVSTLYMRERRGWTPEQVVTGVGPDWRAARRAFYAARRAKRAGND